MLDALVGWWVLILVELGVLVALLPRVDWDILVSLDANDALEWLDELGPMVGFIIDIILSALRTAGSNDLRGELDIAKSWVFPARSWFIFSSIGVVSFSNLRRLLSGGRRAANDDWEDDPRLLPFDPECS